MYSWYVLLFHLPSSFIVESPNPLFAAVVAAPHRKLWPENGLLSTPALSSATLTLSTNLLLVGGLPSLNRKRGPARVPLINTYSNIAVTGQMGEPVHPTNTSTRTLKGSVFDAFSLMRSMDGLRWLSTVTSAAVRWQDSSKLWSLGMLNSAF